MMLFEKRESKGNLVALSGVVSSFLFLLLPLPFPLTDVE